MNWDKSNMNNLAAVAASQVPPEQLNSLAALAATQVLPRSKEKDRDKE